MTNARRSLVPKLLLSLTVGALGLLLVEISLRVLAHQKNQETLHATLARLEPPTTASNAGMANIVRISSNERISYELQPNLQRRTFRKTTVSTDAQGFRVTGEPGPASNDSVTILGIGDSMMFGHGIEDGETYLARLKASLVAAHPERSFQVINTAVPGYNTVMEVETLRTKCLDFDPDLVILHLVGNDYSPPHFVRAQRDVFTWERSFLWKELSLTSPDGDAVRLARGFDLGHTQALRGRDGTGPAPADIEALFGPVAFSGALDNLVELQRAHGFELLVFTSTELGRERTMLGETAERGMEHLSLTSDLRDWLSAHGDIAFDHAAYLDSALVVGPDNAHPSAIQHQLAADRLARWLNESGCLDRCLKRAGSR